jgi:PIN domain nuclease of toxin-antitoxin system
MRLLLDTHVLIWLAAFPDRIPADRLRLFEDPANELAYSVTALLEIAVKNGTRRSLELDPRHFRRRLLESGYTELPIQADHALAVTSLPRLHADLFDRILIAQAIVEDRVLVSADRLVLQYPDVQKVAI